MGADRMRVEGRTTVQYPEWYQQAGQNAVTQANQFYNRPFQQYGGQRVAGMDPMTTGAMGDLAAIEAPSMDMSDLDEIAALWRQYGATPMSTERTVDENGRLGAISDYVNPHVDAALNPALRAMDERAAQERMRMGNLRTSSGAYGDYRHGALEANLAGEHETAVGDVTAGAHMGAFDRAMALRGSDLGRMFNVDLANREGTATTASGLSQVASASFDRASTNYNQRLQNIQAQMAGGSLNQANAQAEMDAAYQEFMREQQDGYDRIQLLLSSLNATNPGSITTTEGPRGHPFLETMGRVVGSIVDGFVPG